MKKEKYMILCVAGQSNAVGYDESRVQADYLEQFRRERIRQLGLYGEDNLKEIPLGVCAQSYQDLRPFSNPENYAPCLGTKGIHLPLADLLLDEIPEDYKILVIPCAYGGCGFTVGEEGSYNKEEMRPSEGILRWGVNSPFYLGMKDRISYALDLNEENQFLGVVWIQGEHDSGDGEGHNAGFDAMAEDFLAYFGGKYPNRTYKGDWDRNIWYNVETVSYWYTVGDCPMIWEHYREWNPATYVEVARTTDSNAANGTGITASIRGAHYGNNAFIKVVAPNVAAKMKENWGRV